MTLTEIKKEMLDLAGQWNGKESGQQEEISSRALEVIEKVEQIETLLEEIKELDYN